MYIDVLVGIMVFNEERNMFRRLQIVLNKFIDKSRFFLRVIFKMFFLKLKEFIPVKTLPYSLAISVTNRCNSKCKTCGIWKLKNKEELTIEELQKILKSIGKNIPWFTITGGEPFLRKDLVGIIKTICDYNSPLVINIATNGTVDDMHRTLNKILTECDNNIKFVINFSIDEIRRKYNYIRGIDAYDKAISNYNKIKKLKKKYPNLSVDINIIISSFNIDRFVFIYQFISKKLQPDSIIVEPATIRRALNNKKMKFEADTQDIIRILKYLINKGKGELKTKKKFNKVIKVFRLEYYRIILLTLLHKKRAIKCFAGTSFAEILPSGDIITCGVRKEILANIKDYDYDFNKAFYSKEAVSVRKKIKDSCCFCTMANPIYSSMILNNKTVLSLIKDLFYNK